MCTDKNQTQNVNVHHFPLVLKILGEKKIIYINKRLKHFPIMETIHKAVQLCKSGKYALAMAYRWNRETTTSAASPTAHRL